ncbi:hypothetical protein ELI24_09920 [Rhizobium ruizarguesonis]|jgi:hypothetical protein|uniref:hypothetical protein n=1 Tax=Rhizobium ruizarguesonis TaxID=2081791 RepID=UPI0010305C08|nr:hypothetical protein [Rhizobium ruizarguesonis]NEJ95358.1 hypothetical protein [Rhizobium ruizarguesonis]TAV98668.1 hypothetical protein ELI24_09920 [Rhizobium ruizarguesonis]
MANWAKAIIAICWLLMCPHQTLAESGIWQYQCDMKNQETHVFQWFTETEQAKPIRELSQTKWGSVSRDQQNPDIIVFHFTDELPDGRHKNQFVYIEDFPTGKITYDTSTSLNGKYLGGESVFGTCRKEQLSPSETLFLQCRVVGGNKLISLPIDEVNQLVKFDSKWEYAWISTDKIWFDHSIKGDRNSIYRIFNVDRRSGEFSDLYSLFTGEVLTRMQQDKGTCEKADPVKRKF